MCQLSDEYDDIGLNISFSFNYLDYFNLKEKFLLEQKCIQNPHICVIYYWFLTQNLIYTEIFPLWQLAPVCIYLALLSSMLITFCFISKEEEQNIKYSNQIMLIYFKHDLQWEEKQENMLWLTGCTQKQLFGMICYLCVDDCSGVRSGAASASECSGAPRVEGSVQLQHNSAPIRHDLDGQRTLGYHHSASIWGVEQHRSFFCHKFDHAWRLQMGVCN